MQRFLLHDREKSKRRKETGSAAALPQHSLQFSRLHPSDVTGGLGQGLLPPLDPYHRERK
nr:MAG TPA: hypothetical protein [Caudoviricetes sp.]